MADKLSPEESFPMLRETPEEIAYELRAHEGALWTGSRMLMGIWAFAFAALGFTYFYLRSANNADLWRPAGITAPTGIGAAVFAFSLATAFLVGYGLWRFRLGSALDWEVAGWTAVLCSLTAVSLQIYQLTELPFFPGSSGYASCFIGWAGMNVVVLLSGAYWLETLLARQLRLRRAVAEDGGIVRSSLPAVRLFRVNLEGCTYFWVFTGFVALLFWALFYVI
jgi:hypothetical protein